MNLKEADGTYFSYVSYLPPNVGHMLNISEFHHLRHSVIYALLPWTVCHKTMWIEWCCDLQKNYYMLTWNGMNQHTVYNQNGMMGGCAAWICIIILLNEADSDRQQIDAENQWLVCFENISSVLGCQRSHENLTVEYSVICPWKHIYTMIKFVG